MMTDDFNVCFKTGRHILDVRRSYPFSWISREAGRRPKTSGWIYVWLNLAGVEGR
jgi:hypothetical protein